MTLPTPQCFLSSLFLASAPSAATTSSDSILLPLDDPFARSLLLTLHCLFSADLIPALDLLDRQLVTRFVLAPSEAKKKPEIEEGEECNEGEERGGPKKKTGKKRAAAAVYYVRSSQNTYQTRARGDVGGMAHFYEVRLRGWSCTCPAFTFASFASLENNNDSTRESHNHGDEDEYVHTREFFGGLLRGDGTAVPVCKHLLACLLVERGGRFEGFVQEIEIGGDELAGWAAGWGG